MQDVLFKSLPHLRKIENPQALAVWLYKVTRNRCWMSRRKSRFAPEHTLSLDELMPEPAELEALLHTAAHSPEAQAISNQNAEQLHQAVQRIPAKYRLILVLHDMEELSAAEVAKITGLQEGTVRVRLHRARLFVRRELAALTSGKARPATKPSQRSNARRSVDCKRIFSGLSDYMDDTLDEASCTRFRDHIQGCAPCVAFLEDLSRAVERCRTSEVPCESTSARALRKVLLQEYQRLTA